MEASCSARKGEHPHCWHSSGHPVQSPTAVLFYSTCCFCAPSYMHIDVLVPHSVQDEDVVAEQMQHGHLVTIKKAPRQGPRLAVPNGR